MDGPAVVVRAPKRAKEGGQKPKQKRNASAEPAKQKPPKGVCKFALSECPYGDKCKYAHEAPDGAAAPQAAAPVEQKVIKCETLGSYFRQKSVGVPKGQRWVHDHLSGEGHPTVLMPWDPIDHVYSHVCRALGTNLILRMICGNLTSASVLAYYGNARDLAAANGKSFAVCGSVLEKPEDSVLTVTLCPEGEYPGDSGRVVARKRVPLGLHDGAFLVDIFWDGEKPLDLESLRSVCSLVRTGEVYVMTRSFVGEAGVDDVPGPPEGAWVKDDAGVISFSPSPSEGCYPGHYAVIDYRVKSQKGLCITSMAHVGPYAIYKVASESAEVKNVAVLPSTLPCGMVEKVDLELPGLWRRALRGVGFPVLYGGSRDKCPWYAWGLMHTWRLSVDTVALYKLNSHALQRITSGRVNQRTHIAVDDAVRGKPLEVLSERFPKFAAHVRVDTATAVSYVGREMNTATMLYLRDNYAQVEDDFVRATAPRYAVPVTSLRRWSLVSGFIAIMGLWVFLTWAQNLGAHAIVLEPTAEEGIALQFFFVSVAVFTVFLGVGKTRSCVSHRCPGVHPVWRSTRCR